MTLHWHSVVVDAEDIHAQAAFWQEVLGWEREYEDDVEVAIVPAAGSTQAGAPALLFLKNPDGKAVKNRLHIDLRPDDQAAEVARLEALGAKRIDIGQGPDVTWVVLADPEGNEFCVLRAPKPDDAT